MKLWLAGLLLAATTAYAAGPTIAVDQAYARATPPGASVGGAFLHARNNGDAADMLIGVAVPANVAERAEIHTTVMDNGVARMRHEAHLTLPARGEIEFKPGGMHVMLIGLKQPLKVGQQLPLTLKFARAGDVPVTVTVRAAGTPMHGSHGHGH